MNEIHLPLLLRKLKKAIQVSEFIAAKLSPDRSLVSLHNRNGDLLLYELGSNDDGGLFLQEFEVKKARQHFWTISQERKMFLLVEMPSNALLIHQFIIPEHKTFVSFKEGLRINFGSQTSDNSSPAKELQRFIQNVDCNTIVCYEISLARLEKKINTLHTLKQKDNNSYWSFSSLQLLNAPYKDTTVLLLDDYLIVVLKIEENSLNIVRDFTIRAKDDEQKIVAVCVRYEWIFVLTSDDQVDVWNLNGTYRGTICVTEPQPRFKRMMTSSITGSERHFQAIDVSSDLHCLCLTCKDFVCVVDLDEYFRHELFSQIQRLRRTVVTEYTLDQETVGTSDNEKNKMSSEESFLWENVFVNTEELNAQRQRFLHWYEVGDNISVQILPRPWFPLQPVSFDDTNLQQVSNVSANMNSPKNIDSLVESKDSHLSTLTSLTQSSVTYVYGGNKLSSKYALNGFNVKRAMQSQTNFTPSSKIAPSSPPTLSISESIASLPKSPRNAPINDTSQKIILADKRTAFFSILFAPSDYKINRVTINPIKFIAELEPSSSELRTFCFFDRQTGEGTLFQLSSCLCLEFLYYSSPSALYYISSQGLCALLFDQTRSQLANGMITFSSAALADKLYALNSWDQRTLRLNALKLGLKYRQLDVVSTALNSLDTEQQLAGAKIVLDFVKENVHVLHDELFWKQLLKMGMIFVSEIIDRKANEITQSSVDKDAFMNSEAYHELLTISDILRQLREFKLNLKSMKVLSNDNRSVLVGSWSWNKSKQSLNEKESFRSKTTKLKPRVLFPSSSQSPVESVTALSDAQSNVIASPKKSASAPTAEQSNVSNTNIFSPQSNVATNTTLNNANTNIRPENTMSSTQTIEIGEVLDERKLDEMDEVTLSFGRFRHSWEKLSDMQIVRDALINSNISMALSFLRWRNRSQTSHLESKLIFQLSGTSRHPFPTLNYFKKLSYPIIYQTVCQGQIQLARKMILNIGESVNTHFKEIAWHTTRRNVRNTLLTMLLEANQLTDEDMELIKFFKQLEEKYPQEDYMSSLNLLSSHPISRQLPDINRQQLQQQQPSESLNIARVRHLDDIPPEVQRELQLSGIPTGDRFINVAKESETMSVSSAMMPLSSASSTSLNFGQWRLKWIATWDNITRYRVLIESAVLDGRPLTFLGSSEIAFGTKNEEAQSLVTYFVAHNDWRRLLYWIESLSVAGYRVDALGRLLRTTTQLHQGDIYAPTSDTRQDNTDLLWFVNVLIPSDNIPTFTPFKK